MTTGDLVSMAGANLGRRKMRSVLASLGVVVGTATIVLLIALATGVKAQINRQFESIGLNRLSVRPATARGGGGRGGFAALAGGAAAERTKKIMPADVARWKAMPGVTTAIPEVDLPAAVGMELKLGDQSRPVTVSSGQGGLGGAGLGILATAPDAVAGTLELPDAGGLVVSQGALQGLGVGSGEAVGKAVEVVLKTSRGETQHFSLKIVGVSPARGASVQISPVDRIAMKSWWFNKTDILENDGYDLVAIRTADVAKAHDLTAQLKKDGFQVQSLEVVVEAANKIIVAITTMLTLLASVALLVATIGIANTMVMAIYERTREIGVLKAIGASSGEIRRLFMVEAGFIGMIGGVGGLLAGWIGGVILDQIIVFYFRSQDMQLRGDFFTVTPWLALGAVVFAIGIGIVAGLLPARRAAALDPLVALRHE